MYKIQDWKIAWLKISYNRTSHVNWWGDNDYFIDQWGDNRKNKEERLAGRIAEASWGGNPDRLAEGCFTCFQVPHIHIYAFKCHTHMSFHMLYSLSTVILPCKCLHTLQVWQIGTSSLWFCQPKPNVIDTLFQCHYKSIADFMDGPYICFDEGLS